MGHKPAKRRYAHARKPVKGPVTALTKPEAALAATIAKDVETGVGPTDDVASFTALQALPDDGQIRVVTAAAAKVQADTDKSMDDAQDDGLDGDGR